MYQYLTLLDDLPITSKQVFKEMYPNQYSELAFFLKNTECYHDLNSWQHEKKKKAEFFFKNYNLSPADYEVLLNAINTCGTTLLKEISLKGKTYTKIMLKKNNKKQVAFYFRPLKVYLSN